MHVLVLLLLSLVTGLPDRWWLPPPIRVNVNIDHRTATLSCDLMLRTWNWSTVLADTVNLHLELMLLVVSILMLHHRLLEMLRRVEIPRKLLVAKVMELGDLIL
jgi:hypothetical protein